MFQISEIFADTYIKAATMSIASNAFKICGIWPYNQNFFSDSDLLAASTSDVTLTKDEPETTFDVQQPFPSVNEQKYF